MAGKNQVRVKDETLIQKSGKDWASWFKLLDKDGAKKMSHTDIAALLSDKHNVSQWWSQMIAVGYEQERGMRVVGEDCNGNFSTGKSVTIAAPAKQLYEMWSNDKKRSSWMNCKLEQRKCTPYKTLRFGVMGGSNLEVRLTPKGADKTQVVVDHMKLKNEKEIERMKKYWTKALADLATKMGGATSKAKAKTAKA
jgi:hypothetical protein